MSTICRFSPPCSIHCRKRIGKKRLDDENRRSPDMSRHDSISSAPYRPRRQSLHSARSILINAVLLCCRFSDYLQKRSQPAAGVSSSAVNSRQGIFGKADRINHATAVVFRSRRSLDYRDGKCADHPHLLITCRRNNAVRLSFFVYIVIRLAARETRFFETPFPAQRKRISHYLQYGAFFCSLALYHIVKYGMSMCFDYPNRLFSCRIKFLHGFARNKEAACKNYY